jgi:DnaK suppressor protein
VAEPEHDVDAATKEADMDEERARTLLRDERRRVEELLAQARDDAESDRLAEDDSTGDVADPAERLTAEGLDDAVARDLQARLDAIDRAERRLREGTYGRSVLSGACIQDERLEADPAAELTVEEAAQQA